MNLKVARKLSDPENKLKSIKYETNSYSYNPHHPRFLIGTAAKYPEPGRYFQYGVVYGQIRDGQNGNKRWFHDGGLYRKYQLRSGQKTGRQNHQSYREVQHRQGTEK